MNEMDIPYRLALDVFGLSDSPSELDINKAYKRLVKCAHPDKGGDKNLFSFITECKNVLLKGDASKRKTSQNSCNNSDSNNTSTTQKSGKKNYYVNLSDLYNIYYYSLGRIQQECNITDIRTSINMYIYPVFRKNKLKVIQVQTSCDFSDLSKFGYVPLKCYVKLPEEFCKYNKFNVSFSLLDKSFSKTLSTNSINSFKLNDSRFDTILDVTLIKSNG